MEIGNACVGCFAGLSCGVRVKIINLLKKKKKLSVMEIARYFKVTQPTITYHLQYLKQVGILKSKKEGRKIYYSISSRCRKECDLFS